MAGGRDGMGARELSVLIDMLITLIVMVVSDTFISPYIKLHSLNTCSLSYVNYTANNF